MIAEAGGKGSGCRIVILDLQARARGGRYTYRLHADTRSVSWTCLIRVSVPGLDPRDQFVRGDVELNGRQLGGLPIPPEGAGRLQQR